MAQPIIPTPTLKVEDAIAFLKDMKRPANEKEKEIFKKMKKARTLF